MKAKRFSAEHIADIMKRAELGAPVGELCRQRGISQQSDYSWKKIYGNMESSETKELRQLRDENSKLKRIVADLSLNRRQQMRCAIRIGIDTGIAQHRVRGKI